ncbi:MAG TPA: hypothetical protein VKR22_04390 [Acidimicrobiales bacterium]|nr:hypothetical protein [Acidimicrobiales bacterium]
MAKAPPEHHDDRPAVRWMAKVARHDFEAAYRYLSLRMPEKQARVLADRLRKTPELETRRANDILRAAGLDPLPLDDPGVMHDLLKVARGDALSPVLVITFEDRAEIADGYHRVSLSYRLDPFGEVPLIIASGEAAASSRPPGARKT